RGNGAGGVENVLHSLRGFPAILEPRQIRHDRLNALIARFEFPAMNSGADARAATEEFFDDVAADKTRAAGHEHLFAVVEIRHRLVSPASFNRAWTASRIAAGSR